MPRNIEIKARVDNLPALAASAAALADVGPTELQQDDSFFACQHGRLKLRVQREGAQAPVVAELIAYQRPDTGGPKTSAYLIAPVSAPDALRDALTAAQGEAGRVRKQRTLYRVGRTRIHLDRVEGLGDFLELEVVLREDEAAAVGVAEAEALMAALGVSATQLVEGAYVDLLAARADRDDAV